MARDYIPDDTVNEVLKKTDIVDVIGRYVQIRKRGRSYIGLCPFHSEKTPSFSVSQEKQLFKCFGCGVSGNVIKFLMEMEGTTFPEVITQLAEDAGITVSWRANGSTEDTPEQKKKRRLIEAYELAMKFYQMVLTGTEQGKSARSYLSARKFTDRLIHHFQIGYAPAFWDKMAQVLSSKGFTLEFLLEGGLVRKTDNGYIDLFRDRIIFPIHNHRGQVIAFAGRALEDGQQPKYLNTPETQLFSKSKVLYNLHMAKPAIRRTQKVVLFEGYADVIKAWECGVHNGVATMGTSLTSEHATSLKRVASEVVICYDGDEAGQNAALKSIQVLEKHDIQVKVAVLPPKMDPDEYIEQNGADSFIKEVIEMPLTAVQFRLRWLRKKYPLQQPDSKLKYIRSALQVISRLQAPSERELYLKEVSEECGIEIGTLKQEILQFRQEIKKKTRIGDNIQKPWNTVMNDHALTISSLKPAYYNAERTLLYLMMHSRELTLEIQEKVGDQFNVEVHAALAAYLYAYFAQHEEVDVSRFVSTLREDSLMEAASSLLMMDTEPVYDYEIIHEYIHHILMAPHLQLIEQKKRELLQAEQQGDVAKAVQIGSEIIALERELKGK